MTAFPPLTSTWPQIAALIAGAPFTIASAPELIERRPPAVTPSLVGFNVFAYGAIGDGVTDDSGAIAATIAAAVAAGVPSGGGATVYFPQPPVAYGVASPIAYTGTGNALTLLGDHGGVGNGTVVKWIGVAAPLMLELAGLWGARVQDLEFDGSSLVETVCWIHSDQPAGGVGFNHGNFLRCSFYDVDTTATDPVTFRVGVPVGGTYDVSLVRWDECFIRGNYTAPELCEAWRQEQGGNTCCFAFEGCDIQAARVGINALQGSSWLRVGTTFFGGITDAIDGQLSACVQLSGNCAGLLDSCTLQQPPGYFCRVLDDGAGVPTTIGNGCTIINCTSNTEDIGGTAPGLGTPVANAIVKYGGPLYMQGNKWLPGIANALTWSPTIIAGSMSVGPAQVAPAGVVCSINNSYGFQALPARGAYAPIFDPQGNPLTGFYGPTYLGFARQPVWSFGDYAQLAGAATVLALEPWMGATPQGGPLQNASYDVGGVAVPTGTCGPVLDVVWSVAGTVKTGDMVTCGAQVDLPAGVFLQARALAANTVRVQMINLSGGNIDNIGIPAFPISLYVVRRTYS